MHDVFIRVDGNFVYLKSDPLPTEHCLSKDKRPYGKT